MTIRPWLIAAVILAAGCRSMPPVTEVHPGVFAAVGDDPQEAVEYANRYCRSEQHARVAVAVDDVQQLAKVADSGHRGIEVHNSSATGFTMNAGRGLEHAVMFRFSCAK